MKDKIVKLWTVYKKNGFKIFMKKCYGYVVANYLNKISFKVMFQKKKYKGIIEEILNSNEYDRIILWRSSFGYNVPLFQRPQHIANKLSKNKCLIFYEVTTMTDKVKILKEHSKNVYLFNFNNIALNKILMNTLKKYNIPKYVELYSTDWKLTIEEIENYINDGFKFIYEYVDDLSPLLSGTKEIPKNIMDKYEYVMANKSVYVVTTAQELKDDVIKKRGKENAVFSSNGVDYEFFQEFDDDYVFENEFQSILDDGKTILCYYGALGKWFDYDLVKKLAKTDKYNIVLFGIKYDTAFDDNKMGEVKNVYFMGTKDYKVLKYYARECDVLMIPFQINSITESTSPCKIFEYMALHKPIVITDLKECRQYKSVYIGHDHKEFINNIDKALKKKDNKKYIEILDKEARENDWSFKAKDIIDLIRKDEKE